MVMIPASVSRRTSAAPKRATNEFARLRTVPSPSRMSVLSISSQPPSRRKWSGTAETCAVLEPSGLRNVFDCAVRLDTSSTLCPGTNPAGGLVVEGDASVGEAVVGGSKLSAAPAGNPPANSITAKRAAARRTRLVLKPRRGVANFTNPVRSSRCSQARLGLGPHLRFGRQADAPSPSELRRPLQFPTRCSRRQLCRFLHDLFRKHFGTCGR
jgi:hypothetical protein